MNNQLIVNESLKSLLKRLQGQNALLVYSPTAAAKASEAGLISSEDLRPYDTFPISCNDKVSYDTLESCKLDYKIILGFGGGTVIDIAKFFSHRIKNSKCVAIPSMLSTNVFATDKIAAIRAGGKQTENSKLPEEIVFDTDLLNLSTKENLYGLADAFSIYTALQDWVYADESGKEPIKAEFYERAVNILGFACEVAQQPEPKGIFKVLLEAGYITNDYGNGRPESGSEHIIAKEIENLITIPHALAVTCGIAITSQLQDTYNCAVQPLKDIGIFDEIRSYSKLTPMILKTALENVTPRKDRYTVLDRFCPLGPRIPSLISGSGLYG